MRFIRIGNFDPEMPKATEDTISSILAEELRSRDIHAETIYILETPVGQRKPDILCQDSFLYPIEAKFRERDLTEALKKIYEDYIKHHKLIGPPPIGGAFAVLYPDKLARPMPLDRLRDEVRSSRFTCIALFPPEDSRPLQVKKGKLEEIASFIAEHVLKPPEKPEVPLQYVVKVLRAAAEEISRGLRRVRGDQFTDAFGGKKVFEYVLQYKEGGYPVAALRQAASFILVNQILFYHILSKHHPSLPELDEDSLAHPADLSNYFEKVLNIDYQVLFAYNIARLVPKRYLESVRTAVAAVKAIGAEKMGPDLVGTIFHDLIPLKVRKYVAAFYTNPIAAELLASLSIESPDAKVADLACGSGGLLVAAYRRKKHLLMKERREMGYPEDQLFTAEDHRRFVEDELLGIDVMPFAAHLAVINLASQAPNWPTNHVNIGIWDSTDLRPGKEIPPVARIEEQLSVASLTDFMEEEPVEEVKGVASPTGRGLRSIRMKEYDVVIMNPPFTRFQRIPPEYKQALLSRLNEYSGLIDPQMNYNSYFVLLADRFTKKGGRIALVLPSTILSKKSSRGVRELLASRYVVEYLITTTQRSAFSEATRFREVLLIAKKGRPDGVTKLVNLRVLPSSPEEAAQLAEKIRSLGKDGDTFSVRSVPYESLRGNTENWLRFVASTPSDVVDEVLPEGLSSELGSVVDLTYTQLIKLRYDRFIAFLIRERGAMRLKGVDVFIIKSEDGSIEVENRLLGKRYRVPRKAVRRALRRLSYVDVMDVAGETDYVIVSTFKSLRNMVEDVLGEEGLKGFLKVEADLIRSWNSVFERKKANILLARRFDLSAPGTRLTAFYSEEPMVGPHTFWCARGVSGDNARILTLWFNSTFAVAQILDAKRETRGAFIDLDKYKLSTLPTLDPSKLDDVARRELLDGFKRFRRIRWPSLLHQLENRFPPRKELDLLIMRALGYEGDLEGLLENLYRSLSSEIRSLKELMAERAPGE